MPKGYPTHFSDEQVAEIIRLYETGLRIEDVGQQFGVSFGAIQNVFHKVGYKPRPAQRRYTVNEHVFDTIDTELPAYWLGFLYADGCVRNTNVTIGLAGKDGDHLLRFADFMESNTPVTYSVVKDKYSKAVITVSGIHLSTRLKELGVLVRRPVPDVMYAQVHESVVHHWLRGFFDGDGGAHSNPGLSFVGSKNLMLIIRELLAQKAGRNPSLSILPFRHSQSICHLAYNRFHNARAVTDFMYQGATVWLPRKRDRIESWPIPLSNSERVKLGWEKRRNPHPNHDPTSD